MDSNKVKMTVTIDVSWDGKYGRGAQIAERVFSVTADTLDDLQVLAGAVRDFAHTLPADVVKDAIANEAEKTARFEAAQAMKATQTDGDN